MGFGDCEGPSPSKLTVEPVLFKRRTIQFYFPCGVFHTGELCLRRSGGVSAASEGVRRACDFRLSLSTARLVAQKSRLRAVTALLMRCGSGSRSAT